MWWAERYGFLVFISDRSDDFVIYSKFKQSCIVQLDAPWIAMGLHKLDCHVEDVLDYIGWLCTENSDEYEKYTQALGMEAVAMLVTIAGEPDEILS